MPGGEWGEGPVGFAWPGVRFVPGSVAAQQKHRTFDHEDDKTRAADSKADGADVT